VVYVCDDGYEFADPCLAEEKLDTTWMHAQCVRVKVEVTMIVLVLYV